jgi:sulfur dioxygenase
MQELDLRLVKAVDTHLHADHITGLGALRDPAKRLLSHRMKRHS